MAPLGCHHPCVLHQTCFGTLPGVCTSANSRHGMVNSTGPAAAMGTLPPLKLMLPSCSGSSYRHGRRTHAPGYRPPALNPAVDSPPAAPSWAITTEPPQLAVGHTNKVAGSRTLAPVAQLLTPRQQLAVRLVERYAGHSAASRCSACMRVSPGRSADADPKHSGPMSRAIDTGSIRPLPQIMQ